jgi:arginase
MRDWVVIGVPSSAGAHHAGQERLRAAGLAVTDAGDLPGAVFAADHEHPAGRSLPAVVRVASETADAVASVTEQGRIPLVIGGDCTITLGVIAGFRRRHHDTGLLYLDGDADLGTPQAGGSGIFDSMGIVHLLGGGAPELAGLDGQPPLLDPGRLAIVGADPRETDDAGRRFLARAGVRLAEAPEFIADPAAVTAAAMSHVAAASGPVVVHFDVDVVDSGDLPLGNFPHYGSGVSLADAVAALRVMLAHPSFAGLVLTEINPTHDPDGSQLGRYVQGLASALGAAEDNR